MRNIPSITMNYHPEIQTITLTRSQALALINAQSNLPISIHELMINLFLSSSLSIDYARFCMLVYQYLQGKLGLRLISKADTTTRPRQRVSRGAPKFFRPGHYFGNITDRDMPSFREGVPDFRGEIGAKRMLQLLKNLLKKLDDMKNVGQNQLDEWMIEPTSYIRQEKTHKDTIPPGMRRMHNSCMGPICLDSDLDWSPELLPVRVVDMDVGIKFEDLSIESCALLQRKMGWPTVGTHRCYNADCNNRIRCSPLSSALCSSCHPLYHDTQCSFCQGFRFPSFNTDID